MSSSCTPYSMANDVSESLNLSSWCKWNFVWSMLANSGGIVLLLLLDVFGVFGDGGTWLSSFSW